MNRNECPLDAARTADRRPTPPAAPLLPEDFDCALFDRDQLEYLSDYYHAALRTHTEYFFTLLRLHPVEPDCTAGTLLINAAIIAKLAELTPALAAVPWRELPRRLGCRAETVFAHKRAIIEAMRTHKRAAAM